MTCRSTNTGTRAWTSTGAGAIGLTWDLRDSQGTVLTSSAKQPLPALQPNQTQSVGIAISVPKEPGTYAVVLGLTDVSGASLTSAGAATATFNIRAHLPYQISAQIEMPRMLHRGEASLLVGRRRAGREGIAPLSVGWRIVDRNNSRTVQQGSSPVGTFKTDVSGTFFAAFVAPNALGTYRLTYELRDGSVSVSEPVTTTVEIVGPRTYPDEGIPLPPSQARVAPAPRFDVPTITIPRHLSSPFRAEVAGPTRSRIGAIGSATPFGAVDRDNDFAAP